MGDCVESASGTKPACCASAIHAKPRINKVARKNVRTIRTILLRYTQYPYSHILAITVCDVTTVFAHYRSEDIDGVVVLRCLELFCRTCTCVDFPPHISGVLGPLI